MEVKQIYGIVNEIQKEILGAESLLQEDLSNIVDIGNEIFNASAVDRYVKALVNHIGKVWVVNRVYRGGAPKILMDGWEFGSVVEKIRGELPEATENESWELEDGASYDPNIFYKPKVSAKFFNSKVTFEIPASFTELQVKQSFSNSTQLNAFISMLYVNIDKSMTLKVDGLIMRTINSMSAMTLYDAYNSGSSFTGASHVRAVNLLYEYNTQFGLTGNDALSATDALTTPEFIRFASYRIGLYRKRMNKMSRLFNIGGTDKFTPDDYMHIVMLAEFEEAAKVYLYDANGQLKDENLQLPKADSVPYWQGSGTDYSFTSTSAINVITPDGHAVQASGILCVIFDRDCCAVCNVDRRVTTNYNAKAEFYNNWYKYDCSYFNDTNENFVLFFVA